MTSGFYFTKSCEWILSWVSAGSLWHDIQLHRCLCGPWSTHISSHLTALTASVAQPATAGAGRAEEPGWGWKRKQQQFITTWHPSHLTDSKRMKALCCDCHRWCMSWVLSRVLTVRSEPCDTCSHTWEGFINHLHQTECHSNYLVLFSVWTSWGGF